MKKQLIIAIVIVFVVLSAVFYGLKVQMPEYRFEVLETGNGIMAALSLLSWLLVQRQMENKPEAFVRGVYSASFLKLMVCMISILVYVMLNRTHIHKPTVFVLFGIYVIYTAIETILLSKSARD